MATVAKIGIPTLSALQASSPASIHVVSAAYCCVAIVVKGPGRMIISQPSCNWTLTAALAASPMLCGSFGTQLCQLRRSASACRSFQFLTEECVSESYSATAPGQNQGQEARFTTDFVATLVSRLDRYICGSNNRCCR